MLLYGNRRAESVMFADEIADLKDTYPDRLQLVHVLSREPQEVELFSGRLDADRLRSMLPALCDVPGTDHWWLCGPYGMVTDAMQVLAELVDRAAFGPAYQALVGEVKELAEPVARLRLAARIARQVYDSERLEFDLLRKAGVVIPELAAIEHEKECGRYEGQASTITLLVQSGQLQPGLDEKEARDIFWTLTARDIYRMLVIERKWSSARYEKWLSDAIVSALVR